MKNCDLNNINREYGPVFNYKSPPNMPGAPCHSCDKDIPDFHNNVGHYNKQHIDDINREYSSTYNHKPSPIMPGIRDMGPKPHDKHCVHGIHTNPTNFQASQVLHPVRSRMAGHRHHVMGLDNPGCSYIPPNDLPIIRKRQLVDQIEGFGSCNTFTQEMILKIVLLCIIIGAGVYLLNNKNRNN